MTTITDAMRQAVLFQLYDVHTALPGTIIEYDNTLQKATVQPSLKKSYRDGTTQEMPILNNVPVIFPRAGGASLTFPVVQGDTCLLLFIERSTDLWKSVGGVVAPDDPRKFDLSDAVAIMGLMPFSENSLSENNEDVLLTYKNSNIRIKSSGEIQIETAGKIAIGSQTTEVLDLLSRWLNVLGTQEPQLTQQTQYLSFKSEIDALKGTL